ncbi:MAG TPA: magnesium transporter [Xanthobacteraceae bacterium]|nr:magnesium transporter [Xanthobacteraceae bacterium]
MSDVIDKAIEPQPEPKPKRKRRRRIKPPEFRTPEGNVAAKFTKAVTTTIRARDAEKLRLLSAGLHESDLGDLIETLPPDVRPGLVELLGEDFDFTALTEVEGTVRAEILHALPPATVADGVRVLESDDAVKILEDLPKEEQDEILKALPVTERVALKRSLHYPEDSAGRLMQMEFVAVGPDWDVGRTIDHLRENRDLPDDFYEIYVADPDQHFVGAVPLDKLLRTQRPVPVSDIMASDREVVRATDNQEDAARMFERYNLVSAPVLDEAGRLVGVLTVDDMVDVIEKKAGEDIKALGGVNPEEQLSDPFWRVTRGRFNWLLVNLATAFLASSVLGLFEGQLQKMVALAVLAPIVASQGGNATTQTMTVVVRALATRELGPANAARVIARELLAGFVNGLAFAVITGVAAVAWFKTPGLGFVIGLAMICNLIAAALGGVLIPLVLYRLRFDPAIASGALITTVTDVTGFFSFLAIATLWFGLA